MIVIIDNYDSFVFNIARYFHRLGEATRVIRNDAATVRDLADLKPGAILISPGPCTPRQAGISMAVVRELSGHIPILGICLGHQCIGSVFGGRVVRARCPMHGRSSYVTHDGLGLFNKLPSPLCVGRYHSLVVEFEKSCAASLIVTARSEEAEIMALAHRNQPTYGLQFHPDQSLPKKGICCLETSWISHRTAMPERRILGRSYRYRRSSVLGEQIDLCSSSLLRVDTTT